METHHLRNLEGVQKPRRKSPLDRSGKPPDVGLAFVLFLIFCTWVAIILYASITSRGKDIERREFQEKLFRKEETKEWIELRLEIINRFANFSSMRLYIGLIMALASASAIIILGYFAPKILSYCGVLGLFVLIIHYSHEIYRIWFSFTGAYPTFINGSDSSINLLTKSIFVIVAGVCVSKGGIGHITDVVAKSIRTLFCRWYLLLFSTFIWASIITVILSTACAVISLATSRNPAIGVFVAILSLLEAFYLSIAIYIYGIAVISQVVATHEWAEDESEVPNLLLFKSMANIARHQMGTIAYASTVVGPFVSGCLAWYRSGKHYIAPSPSSPKLDFISDKVVMWFLVQYTLFYSTMMNAIGVRSFSAATQEVFQLFRKNTCKAYSYFWVWYGVQVIIFVVMTFVFAIPEGLHILGDMEDPELPEDEYTRGLSEWLALYLVSAMIIFLFTIPLGMVADCTVLTIHLCKLKYEAEETDQRQATYAAPLNIGWRAI